LFFWCPYFDSRFPTAIFEKLEMDIGLLGVRTRSVLANSQLPTPKKLPLLSIGLSGPAPSTAQETLMESEGRRPGQISWAQLTPANNPTMMQTCVAGAAAPTSRLGC